MEIYWKSVSDIAIEKWANDAWVWDLLRERDRLREKLGGVYEELGKMIVATQMKDAVIRELNEKLDKLKEKYGDLDF